MPLQQFNADVWVLAPSGSTGDVKDYANTSVNLSTYDRTTYQWQNDTLLQGGNSVTSIWDLDDLNEVGFGDPGQSPPPDEGVLVNGTLLQIQTLSRSGDTVVTMSDSTQFTVVSRVIELTDGTMLFTIRDVDILLITLLGYEYSDITDIAIGEVLYNTALTPENYSLAFVCFVAGTRIETADGLVNVCDLAPGDMVRTKDNGYKPIQWIGERTLDLTDNPNADKSYPVRIKAGALGRRMPETDLYVSQQHRILIKSRVAKRMTGLDEVLIPAKKLLETEGIDIVDDCDEVTYVHFLFDQHEIVYSNGAETESLYTGAEALKALTAEARAEILGLFPELTEMTYRPAPSRAFPCGRVTNQLLARISKNNKPLYASTGRC